MNIRSIVLGIALSAAALAAGAGLVALFAFRALDSAPTSARIVPDDAGVVVESADSCLFVVESGESASSVGERLEKAGIIRSALLWRIAARVDSARIKAGTYRIQGRLGMLAIRELFVSGKQLLIKLTIPEGSTLKKIAAALEAKGIVDSAAFLSAARDESLLKSYDIPGPSFEGYLYPDTYLFPKEYAADKVVKTMAETFFDKVADIAPRPLDTYAPKELFDRVVLASIVEREYRVPDEAPLIAGVFQNRLKIGMALQSCATVEYVITEIQGKPHPDVLYNRDIAIKDPYNTYIRPGLPPGPISSPGLVALEAAFNPASVDYLYFRLVDPAEGRHRFSRTLDEHIKAGVIYVKRLKAGS